MTQLTLDKTWNVMDNTKVTEFMRCPRRFFFHYVLGWEPDSSRNDLWFGESVHKAMAVLLLNMPFQGEEHKAEVILKAYKAFEESYRMKFPESTDELHAPKVPSSVFMMLNEYVGLYGNVDQFKVKHVEVAGTVSVGHEFPIHWRIDAVAEDDRGIFAIEHKTASKLTQQWTAKWSQANQIDTYTHVLNCFYPNANVYGVIVNGLVFNKTQRQFQRVPVRKTGADMQAWLWNINHWLSEIDFEYDALSGCNDDAQVMEAFPKQTEACSDFFGCPYLPICSSWHNPLREVAQGPPIGFSTRFWDPREHELTAREVKHLTV